MLTLVKVFITLMIYHVSLTAAQKCYKSVSGIAVKNFVLESHRVDNILDCYEKCISVRDCKSINWYQKTILCELNNITTTKQPNMTVFDLQSVYIEKPANAEEKQPAESCRTHCFSYTEMNDPTRDITKKATATLCDSKIVQKWYRFIGIGGVKMSDKCMPSSNCNTHATAWLSEPHPTTEEGLVKRKVCYHWSSNCCYFKNYINVCNCGGFYIYEFVKPSCCSCRYCSIN